MKLELATFFWSFTALVLLSLNGCSAPSLETRQLNAASIVPPTYGERTLVTQSFDLRSYTPREKTPTSELRVFVEGDGFAWERRDRPSSDPTPITQTALSLVATSTQPNVVYLARPCQFVGAESRNCDEKLWTNERYSEAVVASLDEALDDLKTEYGSDRIILIGYSGGGTIAALLAARRPDVSGMVTLAAPLDIAAFTDFHHVTPMTGSLNPIDVAHALSDIPQIHIVGDQDKIVPPVLVQEFMQSLPASRCTQLITVPADHWSGWTDIDPNPADLTPTCEANKR